ncbi:hypothetical protein MBLNU457_g1026t1 [Dothideomycetes sp. NU457]
MAGVTGKRRRVEKKGKKENKFRNFKKQKSYHSSSEDESDVSDDDAGDFAPVNMDASDEEVETKKPVKSILKAAKDAPIEDDEVGPDEEKAEDLAGLEEVDDDDDEEDDEFDLEGSEDDDATNNDASEAELDNDDEEDEDDDMLDETTGDRKKRKRNDPSVFANSMSKILSSKLSTSKRADPVLSRSATAQEANRELTDAKLELKAKRKMRAEKQQALERGRVKDVLGLNTIDISTAGIQEQEKRLKKTAQRGVVKLFNAVRMAQLQGQKAMEAAKKQGIVGMAQREEKVNEMSKQGFLDLIASGGKKAPAINV